MNLIHTHYLVTTPTGQVLGLKYPEAVSRIKAEIEVHGPDHRVELCGNGRLFLGAHEYVLVSLAKPVKEG